MKLKHLLIIGGLILAVGFGVYTLRPVKETLEKTLGLATAEFQKYTTDVIGTKIGTTTTGVAFSVGATGGQSATTSYVTLIGNRDEVTYTGQILEASSTANMQIDFLGSSDDYCNTTNTDVDVDTPLVVDINWFDIGGHLLNLDSTGTFDNGTSTLAWDTSGLKGVGKAMTLTNLDYRCLRIDVSGSSTLFRAELRTK